jgi:DNA-binding Xre family transcriptional regulator
MSTSRKYMQLAKMKHRLRNRVLFLLTEKERREGRRIKQLEIAKAIQVSPHTVGSWLRDEVTKLEAHVIEGLCEYFECDVCDLLYLEPMESDKRES